MKSEKTFSILFAKIERFCSKFQDIISINQVMKTNHVTVSKNREKSCDLAALWLLALIIIPKLNTNTCFSIMINAIG